MNVTEIRLRDSNKSRFTLEDAYVISVRTDPEGRDAFETEWLELLPSLVMLEHSPHAIYAFREDV
jgi:hypothetical protein